jgi:hypothetical protein
MTKTLLIILFLSSIVSAKSLEPKAMRAKDNRHSSHYSNSSHHHDSREDFFSSSAEATAQISIAIFVQATSEITSEGHQSNARLSYLDNNRVQITKEIAQGQGEYLKTLLSMMNLPSNPKNLKNLQENFEKLIYLSHDDFLKKLKVLV